MEQWFQDNRTYVGAACAPPAGTAKYFNFACAEQTANSFTIQATGIGAMAGFNYTIDESGGKSSTGPAGWAGNANCWAIKKDGSC